ncbi:sensor histidine kinase [Kitasatospora sp. NPDC059571]|uniref:sensor histidine kinase n=1 Tax=Kitasatospora sp. NPDC059571 TaxID=3346871 RepID=UPI003681097F
MTHRQIGDCAAGPCSRSRRTSAVTLLVAGSAAVGAWVLAPLSAAGVALFVAAVALSAVRPPVPPSNRAPGGCQTCEERVRRAAAAERARLARGLHDSLGKTVDGIALAAEALAREARNGRPDLADRAGQIAAAAGQASREARDLMTGLRGAPTAGGTESLREAIERTAATWSARALTGWTVHVAEGLDGELGGEVRCELLLIVDEALANAVRHASASHLWVTIARDGLHRVEVAVCDDGEGFDPASVPADRQQGERYGVLGMRERAELLGGTLRIGRSRQGGTELRVRLPLASPTGSAMPGACAVPSP